MTTTSPEFVSDVAAADIATELLNVILPIRRALRRALRRAHPAEALPQAQVEVLGVIERQPGISVQQVAQLLQLAPNSVSTLVNQLTREGLVDRQRHAGDRRSVRLSATPEAVRLLTARRQFRRETTQLALAGLSAGDRRRIQDALPALRLLLAGLEEQR